MEFLIACVSSVIPVPHGVPHLLLGFGRLTCFSPAILLPLSFTSLATRLNVFDNALPATDAYITCFVSSIIPVPPWTCTSTAYFRHPGASWSFTSPALFLPSSQCPKDLHITCLFLSSRCLMELHITCLFPSPRRLMEFHTTCLFQLSWCLMEFHITCIVSSVIAVPYGLAHQLLISVIPVSHGDSHRRLCFFRHPSASWTCKLPAYFRHPGASWSLTSLALFITSTQCPMDLHITCLVSSILVPHGGSHQPLTFCRLGAPVSLTSPVNFLPSQSPLELCLPTPSMCILMQFLFPTLANIFYVYDTALPVADACKYFQIVESCLP